MTTRLKASIAGISLSSALCISLKASGAFAAWFAAHVSNPITRLNRALTSAIPFPASEALVYVLALFAIASLARALTHAVTRRKMILLRSWSDGVLLTLSAILLVYALTWPAYAQLGGIRSELSLPESTHTASELKTACETLIERANAIQLSMPGSDARFAYPYSDESMLGMASFLVGKLPFIDETPPAPKLARYPEFLRALGIAGVYTPWTGEALLNGREPLVTRLFTACHEAAHAIGYAREEDANFIAYEACLLGDAYFQYSGTLSMLRYAMDALRPIDAPAWSAMRKTMNPAVERDYYTMNGFGDAKPSAWTGFMNKTAEAFMRMNGQDGLESYGEVLDLFLQYESRENR